LIKLASFPGLKKFKRGSISPEMALFVGMGELLGDGSRSAFPGYILPQSLSIDAAASFSNYIKSANLASIQENYADIAQWIYLSARGKQAGPLPEI